MLSLIFGLRFGWGGGSPLNTRTVRSWGLVWSGLVFVTPHSRLGKKETWAGLTSDRRAAKLFSISWGKKARSDY